MTVGTQVIGRAASPPRSAPTDTGVWFPAGFAPKGPIDRAVEVTSMDEFERTFGVREAYAAILYDSVDTYFHEGGARAVIAREVGPTPVKATVNLMDGVPAIALVAKAKTVGDWANGLKVQVVVSGGNFTIQVLDAASTVLEVSPLFADQAAAVAWTTSSYIDLTLGAGSADPINQTVTLASGTDDHASAVDANLATALALFTKDLGPGQVSAPGRTTASVHAMLDDHAAANSRVALKDEVDTATTATLTAQAALTAATAHGRFGGAFWPWVVVPGIAVGTTRVVPPSALLSGIISRNDGAGLSPNEPSAGDNGLARWAIGLSQAALSDPARDALNDVGVNVIVDRYNNLEVFGYRTGASPVTDPDWVGLGNARLYMAIASLGNQILDRYVLKQIDGKRKVFSRLKTELIGELTPFYDAGSLFGDTPEEAFYVDTGPQVNTTASIAARQIRAVMAVRMSEFGELVVLEIVKTRITEALA